MSQAEMLLNEMTGIPVHEHPIIDSDSLYTIDPISRTITNTSGKNILIQFDHNSERFTFEIPRYVDGHDMSLCNATKVHYVNIEVVEEDPNATTIKKPKTKVGMYEVNDIQVSPDDDEKVICSWLISRNATQLSGTLSFLIQYACVDEDNNLTYEWHTDIHTDVLVNTGMNNGVEIIASSADIIEQWKRELFSDVQAQVEADIQEISGRFQNGKDGYTPVRGVDYWTEEDKNEMINTIAPKAMTVTLTSSGWGSNRQTVSAPGVTSDTTKTVVVISPEPSSENFNAYVENSVRCITQGNSTLTFQCESVPTINIMVNVAVYYVTSN